MKIVSGDCSFGAFLRKWLRHTLCETSEHLVLDVNEIEITYDLLALQLDPSGWKGDMERGRSRGREGGWKRGRAEEVRQKKKDEARQIRRRRKRRMEEARKGGGRKRGWAL